MPAISPMTYDQALETARINTSEPVFVVLVTNQFDGKVSFAHGHVEYNPGFIDEGRRVGTGLTTGDRFISYLFSDRVSQIPVPGQPTPIIQPFNAEGFDKLQLHFRKIADVVHAEFILASWGTSFNVEFETRGGILIGNGASIGNSVSEAVYLVSWHTQAVL